MTTINLPEGLIKPEVEFVGMDGNAFSIIGIVSKELRHAGNTPDVVSAFADEAMSGDYDHALRTALNYTTPC